MQTSRRRIATIPGMIVKRLFLLIVALGSVRSDAAEDLRRPGGLQAWPQWRGPLATGVAPGASPPTEWSETKNIRWKAALPGRGHSTPVIWGDRIFLTTAEPYGEARKPQHSTAPGTHDGIPVTHNHYFVAMAVSRQDGKILWRRVLNQAFPHEGGHFTGSLASNSPVVDDRYVFVFFGSYGLYCLDHDGEIVWKADLGQMQTLHGHGEASSPVLAGDTLIVNWDHEGQSFVIAFDKQTGKQKWKVLRDEVTSWASPIITEHAGRPQLIISGTNRVRGYDVETGRVIWECGGLSSNIVASPVAASGMVFAGSSYDKRALLAIRLDGARGDVTGTKQVAWSRTRGTPYVPSPLLYDDSLYFLTHYQGIITRVSAATGEDRPGAVRLGELGDIYASPVGAANRVYVTDREGRTAVLNHSDRPSIVAINRLSDTFNASAAIVDRELYLRGERFLYCIAEP